MEEPETAGVVIVVVVVVPKAVEWIEAVPLAGVAGK